MIIKLEKFGWVRHVVGMANERYCRMTSQVVTQGKRPQERPEQFWEDGEWKFVMKEELK